VIVSIPYQGSGGILPQSTALVAASYASGIKIPLPPTEQQRRPEFTLNACLPHRHGHRRETSLAAMTAPAKPLFRLPYPGDLPIA